MWCFSQSKRRDQHDANTSSSNLKVFKFSELQHATNNFHESYKIGEGEFGGIFFGSINILHINTHIAVQVIKGSILKAKTNEDWVKELEEISVVRHPNLGKILGYCIYITKTKKKIVRFVVQQLVHHGSVRKHLTNLSHPPLPWATRLKIARNTARALAFLHENQIIMRCFRSSSVLLDQNFDVKISDYFLARLGPFPRAFVESEKLECVPHRQLEPFLGYMSPEFLNNDYLTVKKDVWCFGIFLLELITGKLPFDKTRPHDDRMLVNLVRPHLHDTTEFEQIIDSRLQGQYSIQSVLELAAVAELCLKEDKKMRPTMSQVFYMVSQVVEGVEIDDT